MGSIAAKKLRAILENAQHVLAIELVCACQALEFVERRKLACRTGGLWFIAPYRPWFKTAHTAQEIGSEN